MPAFIAAQLSDDARRMLKWISGITSPRQGWGAGVFQRYAAERTRLERQWRLIAQAAAGYELTELGSAVLSAFTGRLIYARTNVAWFATPNTQQFPRKSIPWDGSPPEIV